MRARIWFEASIELPESADEYEGYEGDPVVTPEDAARTEASLVSLVHEHGLEVDFHVYRIEAPDEW